MERKLASVQKILNIRPIEGADKIEVCQVLGWECVIAKKDKYKIGDLVVYFEVDSALPENNENFSFLKDRGYRIKTIKLRKQISQGLVMPLSILPSKKWNEGDNVSSILNIKKYDPQGEIEEKIALENSVKSKNGVHSFLSKYRWYRNIFSKKYNRSGFPSFIKKTDENRIQLFPDICEREKDTSFIVTEKIDGQSLTVFLVKNSNRFLWFGKKYIFGVCSRNYLLGKPDDSSYWTIARNFQLEKVLENIIGNNDFVVLQGEIIGDKIQGNKYGVKGYDFYAFNLILPGEKIDSISAANILKEFGIKFVPILNGNFQLLPTIQDMVSFARGKSVVANIEREGVVIRNYEKNISFKVINPEFLLKHDA